MVHDDEVCYLVQSSGQENIAGKLVESYASPVSISAQIQTLGGDGLLATNETIHDSHDRRFWIYADSGIHYPLNADRLNQLGSDFIYRPSNSSWYKIYNIAEDFSRVNWVLVYGALQTKIGGALAELQTSLVGIGVVGIANIEISKTGAAKVNSALAGDDDYSVQLLTGIAQTDRSYL